DARASGGGLQGRKAGAPAAAGVDRSGCVDPGHGGGRERRPGRARSVTGAFGSYDFGLAPDAEARAQRLHAESGIIDILFQGPCGYRAFSPEHQEEIERAGAGTEALSAGLVVSGRVNLGRLLSGEWPESRQVWEASGITAGNRQFTMRSRDLGGS